MTTQISSPTTERKASEAERDNGNRRPRPAQLLVAAGAGLAAIVAIAALWPAETSSTEAPIQQPATTAVVDAEPEPTPDVGTMLDTPLETPAGPTGGPSPEPVCDGGPC